MFTEVAEVVESFVGEEDVLVLDAAFCHEPVKLDEDRVSWFGAGDDAAAEFRIICPSMLRDR